jgi:hypothetical protein
VRRVLAGAACELDPGTPALAGEGTRASPVAAGPLPFGDLRAPPAAASALGAYACAGSPPAPGPEVVYRFTLAARTPVRAMAFDRGARRARLFLLDATGAEGGCLAAAEQVLERTLAPGTYHLVVESPAGAGEVTFALAACDPEDARCAP